jgi:hypothetical protein
MTEHHEAPVRRDEPRERAMPLAKKPHLQNYGGEVIASAPISKLSGDIASTQAAPATGPSPVSAPAQAGAVSAAVQAGSPEVSAAQSSQPPPAAPGPYAMGENAATAPRALAKSVSSFAARGYGPSEVSNAPPGAGAAIGASAATAQLQQATSPSSGPALGSGGGAIVGAAVPRAASPPEVLAMISPPDQSAGWQVGRNGLVLRRDPDGSTHPQHSGVTTDLTAGAAPSATVCWIVGRSGTIIRTADGEHWVLITPPTGDNFVAVASDSADHAVVTTAAGQNFATTDGGSSWHRQ